MAGPFYVDGDVGADGNAGTSEGVGNAWASLEKLADTIAAGEIGYVKSSITYTATDSGAGTSCNMELTENGNNANYIQIIGYSSTIADNGVVTVDADANSHVNALQGSGTQSYKFKNFRFTGASGHAVASGAGMKYENCRADNSDDGFNGANNLSFYNCLADNNAGSGFYTTGNDNIYIHVISHTNTEYGIFQGTGHAPIIGCLIYNNTGNFAAIYANAWTYPYVVYGCSIDKDNGSGGNERCIQQNQSASGGFMAVNNILFDANEGIYIAGTNYHGDINDGNLFYSNTTDRTNASTGDNDISGSSDPFTASATRDYSLKSGSEAIDAGVSVQTCLDFWGL